MKLSSADIGALPPPGRTPESRRLRTAVEELVGIAFFQPMLELARSEALRGKYGHGGRGEDVFAEQLDIVLGRQLSSSPRFGLQDAIYERLMKNFGYAADEFAHDAVDEPLSEPAAEDSL